jgi:hypothetical protein
MVNIANNTYSNNDNNTRVVDNNSVCPNIESPIVCPGANINSRVDENLMATIPGLYMGWKYLMLFLFLIVSGLCVREIMKFLRINYTKYLDQFHSTSEKRRAKRKKSLRHYLLSTTFLKLILLFLIAFVRFLWLLDPHANSKTVIPGTLFGKSYEQHSSATMPLLTVPQLLFVFVLILEVDQWQQVIATTKRLQGRSNHKNWIRLCKNILMLLPLLVVITIIISCSAAGSGVGWHDENNICYSIWQIYMGTFALYCLLLGIAGFYYSYHLYRMIKALISSFKANKSEISKKEKYLNKTKRILTAVIFLTALDCVLMGMFIYRRSFNVCCDKDQLDSNHQYLFYIFVIHLIEMCLICAILNSVKIVDYGKKQGKNLHQKLKSQKNATLHTTSIDMVEQEESIAMENPLNKSQQVT